MKRHVGACVVAAALSGCMSANQGGVSSEPTTVRASGNYVPYKVPGITGPWGEPISMAAPYTASPPMTAWQSKNMLAQSVPLNLVQMGGPGMMPAGGQMPGMQMPPPGMQMPPGMAMMPPGGLMAPPGVPLSPPLMTPGGGMMPGGSMPMLGMGQNGRPGAAPRGSPVMPAAFPGGAPPGSVAALGAMSGGQGAGAGYTIGRTQVRFAGPDGLRVAWLTQGQDGKPTYSGSVVEAPGRYNFTQASIYRLKLSSIRGRPGLEVYPTLEVVPGNPKTSAFLAHSAVPLEFTPEDFQEISEGKYLVKVIYLPDPQYQELAAIGTDQIISTRLEPGADPILEAQRRGCILLVIRMGNVDHEAPNTPPLDSASPAQGPAGATPPGLVPAPGIPGPLSPIPGPATPPARDGIGLPPQQPNTNAIAPLNPGALVPPPGPGLGGVSKMREVPPLSPTGAMLPELPPRPSALLPELPSAPPAPADLATQGAKK